MDVGIGNRTLKWRVMEALKGLRERKVNMLLTRKLIAHPFATRQGRNDADDESPGTPPILVLFYNHF